MTVLRALRAESLKTKRTLALWLAILAPLSIVALQVVTAWSRGPVPLRPGDSPWNSYSQQVLVFWSLLMLPLFVTLETALVAGLEHSNGSWKQLFALPIPRWTIYFAKQTAGMAIIGLSWVALVLFTVLGGLALRAILPEVMSGWPIPWRNLVVWAGLAYLSSWLMISIHTWVGLRWGSFVVALGAGIVMTVAGVVVINDELAAFYPWTMPTLVANGFYIGDTMLNLGDAWPVKALLAGALGGIAVALAGGWDVLRRDVL